MRRLTRWNRELKRQPLSRYLFPGSTAASVLGAAVAIRKQLGYECAVTSIVQSLEGAPAWQTTARQVTNVKEKSGPQIGPPSKHSERHLVEDTTSLPRV